jgi:hypothetical protein
MMPNVAAWMVLADSVTDETVAGGSVADVLSRGRLGVDGW